MIRTQIQLTDEQAAQLRETATRLGVSVAEVVRRLVDQTADTGVAATGDEIRSRALEVVGKFASGRSDVAAEHDRHLAEALGS